MARYTNPFPQYITITGAPNNGGFLKFFESGNSVPKNVFSDSALTTSIGSVVQLDGSGRVPTIFLNGAYRVTLTDPAGNETDSADPIGVDTDQKAFDLWLITNTYNIGDIVQGSDDLYYRSLVNSNLGTDPTTQPSLVWEQFFFLPTWNSVNTYSSGRLVIGSDDRAYQSQTSNFGNDPISDDGTNWQKLLQQDDDVMLSGINIEKLDAGTANLDWLNNSVLRWRWLFDTDESLDLERYNSSGVLQDKIFSFNNLTGATAMISDVTLTGDLSVTSPNVTFSQDTLAGPFELFLTSDASQIASIELQDAGIRRWEIGQNTVNNFSLTSYDAAGVNPQPILGVLDSTTNLTLFSGNLLFDATNQGLAVTSSSNSTLDFNFTGVSTATAFFDFFDNTTTTGDRLFNIWKGNVTNAITFQVDAETGTIHPSFDRAGEVEPGVKLGKITLSQNAPTGGEDGDLWLRF